MAVWMMGFSLRPARRMISYEMPATTGSSRMREAMRSARLGQPRNAKTKIETSMTISRKFVPQRGWSRENFCTFSTVSGSPAS